MSYSQAVKHGKKARTRNRRLLMGSHFNPSGLKYTPPKEGRPSEARAWRDYHQYWRACIYTAARASVTEGNRAALDWLKFKIARWASQEARELFRRERAKWRTDTTA